MTDEQYQYIALWDNLMDIEASVIYYRDLSWLYKRWQNRLNFFVFITSSGAAASLLITRAPGIWQLFSAIVAVVALIPLAIGLPDNVQKLYGIYTECILLCHDYEKFWNERSNLSERKAIECHEALASRYTQLNLKVAELPRNKKLNDKAYREVYKSRTT